MKVTIVDGDDWMGLYINGKLELQGHSLRLREVILVITGENPERIEADAEWLYKHGQMPNLLSEVKAAP